MGPWAGSWSSGPLSWGRGPCGMPGPAGSAPVSPAAGRATVTSLPWLVTAASIRSSLSCGRINKPRSAPAYSMALRMTVSSSFSRTISPDTASDTLITVARSRCSTVSAITVGVCGAISSRSSGYVSSICRTLPGAPPAAVAAPRVPSIRVSKRGEASICVEARRQLECQRLLLHEAVVPGRTDRLLVQVHGLRRPAVDPREFRKHECVAVAIVLRTVLGPESQLPQLALEKPGELHLLARRRRRVQRGQREGVVKVMGRLDRRRPCGVKHQLRLARGIQS